MVDQKVLLVELFVVPLSPVVEGVRRGRFALS